MKVGEIAVLIEFKGGVNAPWIAKQTARLFSNLDFNSLARAATDPNGVVLDVVSMKVFFNSFFTLGKGIRDNCRLKG